MHALLATYEKELSREIAELEVQRTLKRASASCACISRSATGSTCRSSVRLGVDLRGYYGCMVARLHCRTSLLGCDPKVHLRARIRVFGKYDTDFHEMGFAREDEVPHSLSARMR
jgi:hypothetical protein